MGQTPKKRAANKRATENRAAEKSAFAGERIAKVLARAGVCSRRDAEKLIAEGRVSVDGRRLDTPAFNVSPQQKISVDGKLLGAPDPPRLWRFHKTTGLVTTTRDPEGRPTVFQKLPPDLPRLNAVGRLDINTEGLLLMTNDGGLKRFLELPSTGWLRRYRVRAFGTADPERLADLKNGIECRTGTQAGRQCMDERRVARRQKSRDQARARAFGFEGEPADPLVFRAFPAGQS